MPDHVRIIFTPLIDDRRQLVVSLAEITKAIKGTTAHRINRRFDRRGTIWQEESFDHVLRSSESLETTKIAYVLENPISRAWQPIGTAIHGSGTNHSRIRMRRPKTRSLRRPRLGEARESALGSLLAPWKRRGFAPLGT